MFLVVGGPVAKYERMPKLIVRGVTMSSFGAVGLLQIPLSAELRNELLCLLEDAFFLKSVGKVFECLNYFGFFSVLNKKILTMRRHRNL